MNQLPLIEHEHGVLPLLDLFATDPDGLVAGVRERRLVAGLGLFGANARFDATEPTLRGARAEGRIVVRGRIRVANQEADLWLTGVTVDDRMRLALLPRGLPTVHTGGSWVSVAGASLPEEALSATVSWGADGPLVTALDACAWQYSRLATEWSATVVADLRRALAATGVGTDVLATSQYLAHELTKLEIEIGLAGAAARFGADFKAEPAGGPAVAAVSLSAADIVQRTVAVAKDLTAELGLDKGPCAAADWPDGTARTAFGGRRMAEFELASRMGLTAWGPGR